MFCFLNNDIFIINIGFQYRFIVKIDCTTYWDVVNSQAEQFTNVAIFAGKGSKTSPGKIRNVMVKSMNE